MQSATTWYLNDKGSWQAAEATRSVGAAADACAAYSAPSCIESPALELSMRTSTGCLARSLTSEIHPVFTSWHHHGHTRRAASGLQNGQGAHMHQCSHGTTGLHLASYVLMATPAVRAMLHSSTSQAGQPKLVCSFSEFRFAESDCGETCSQGSYLCLHEKQGMIPLRNCRLIRAYRTNPCPTMTDSES